MTVSARLFSSVSTRLTRDPEASFGMMFYWGVMLAEVQNHPLGNSLSLNRPRLAWLLSSLLIFVGFGIASLPEKPEWASWSLHLRDFLKMIGPPNPEYTRFSTGLGLAL